VLFYVVFVCKCVLPPGDNPVAVNKYINVCYSSPYIQPESEKPPDIVPIKEPSEIVCDVVVAAVTSSVEVRPRTVDDSVVSVPSSKIDSVNEQSALTPKPNSPSETKLPSDSAMTVTQSHTTMASSPSSVLLAKHWGPERLVEILREPNCSLGISIVGGKVRNDIMRRVVCCWGRGEK
jgi:hypothetical protein